MATTPKKQYVWGTVKGKRTRIEKGRAARIRARISGQKAAAKGGGGEKPGMPKPKAKPKAPVVPGPYSGLGNTKAIDQAVASVVNSQIAPLSQQLGQVNAQLGSNIKANASLTRQTQGTLATLLENARRGGGAMMQTAAQGAAAMRGSQDAAAREIQNAFGGQAMNEQTRAQLAQGFAPTSAQINADAVGNIYGAGLGAQLQQDFFGRAQAVAATTQQAFNQGQREAQSRAVKQIAGQIAAARGQGGALRRQFMREDAQFNLERETADRAFGMQVAGLKAEELAAQAQAQAQADQTAYDRQQDAIDNGEDFAALKLREQALNNSGATSAAKEQAKLSDDQRKQVFSAIDYVRKQAQRVGMAGPTLLNSDGTKVPSQLTNSDVFGKGNGPFRELFKRLERAGMTPAGAAMLTAQEYPSSITRSTPAKMAAMLTRLRVPAITQKQIIVGQWGTGAWADLHPEQAINSGGGMPSPAAAGAASNGGTVATSADSAKAWVKKLKGRQIKAGIFTGNLVGYVNGKWVIQSTNGRKTSIPVVPGQSPVTAVREWWKRYDGPTSKYT